jgi:hypothetical protein
LDAEPIQTLLGEPRSVEEEKLICMSTLDDMMKISSDMERYRHSAGRAGFKVPRKDRKFGYRVLDPAIVLGTKAGAYNSDGSGHLVVKPPQA